MGSSNTDLEAFERKHDVLRTRLEEAGMGPIAQHRLHTPTSITVEMNKRFTVHGGQTYTVSFALYVGEAESGGEVWASSEDTVIHKPVTAYARILSQHSSKVYIKLPDTNTWPTRVLAGVRKPMDPRTLAMVSFDIVRWAAQAKPANIAEVVFPDPEILIEALKVYTPANGHKLYATQGTMRPSWANHRPPSIPYAPAYSPVVGVPHTNHGQAPAYPRLGFSPHTARPHGPQAQSQARDYRPSDRASSLVHRSLSMFQPNLAPTHLHVRESEGSNRAINAVSRRFDQVGPILGNVAVQQPARSGSDVGVDRLTGGADTGPHISHSHRETESFLRELHRDSDFVNNHNENILKAGFVSVEETDHHVVDSDESGDGDCKAVHSVTDESDQSQTSDQMPHESRRLSPQARSRAVDIELASSAKLRRAIDVKAQEMSISADMGALPDLSYFRFEQHRIDDYLPVRLLIGECYVEVSIKPLADETNDPVTKISILCHLWAQLKPIQGVSKAPHVEYVAGRPVVKDVGCRASVELSMKAAQKGVPYDQLLKKLEDRDAKLGDMFCWFSQKKHELQALIKYAYILAAESPTIALDEHFIPQGVQFVKNLIKICQRLGPTLPDALRHGTNLPFHGEQADRRRRSYISSAAAASAKLNELWDLNGVSKEQQERIDANLRLRGSNRKPRLHRNALTDAKGDEKSEPAAQTDFPSESASVRMFLDHDMSEEDEVMGEATQTLPRQRMQRARPVVVTSSDCEDDEDVCPQGSVTLGSYRSQVPSVINRREEDSPSHLAMQGLVEPRHTTGSATGRTLHVDDGDMNVDNDDGDHLPHLASRRQAFGQSALPGYGSQGYNFSRSEHANHQNSSAPNAQDMQSMFSKREIRGTFLSASAVPFSSTRSDTANKRRKLTGSMSPQRRSPDKNIGAKIDVLDRRRREVSGRIEKRLSRIARDTQKNLRDFGIYSRYDDELMRTLLEQKDETPSQAGQ